MITINIRTLFQGDVGVADPYIKQAQETGESITVVREDGAMLIPNSEMKERCTGRGGPFKNKYGPGHYFLYYFKWKPDVTQAVMI